MIKKHISDSNYMCIKQRSLWFGLTSIFSLFSFEYIVTVSSVRSCRRDVVKLVILSDLA